MGSAGPSRIRGAWTTAATRRLRTYLPVAVLFTAGCAGDGRSSGPIERDSAGVRIVETVEPLWHLTEGWQIDPDPVVRFGAEDGPPGEFYRVADMARLHDGTVAVAMVTEVRFFSAEGHHVGTFGEDGEGPGEFRSARHVVPLAPDSLLVYDPQLRRGTVLGPDLSLARTFQFEGGYLAGPPIPFGDGFLMMGVWPSVLIEGGRAGLVRTPVPVLHLSRTGGVVDTVLTAPGSEVVRIHAFGNRYTAARPLFGRSSHLAVRGDEILLGSADEMQFRVFDRGGTPIGIVRREGADLELTPELLEAERSARLGLDASSAGRELFDALPVPARRAAYADLRVDATGAVWLSEHRGELRNRLAPEPRTWQVVDREGIWLGPIDVPGRFHVFEFGEDYVLGVYMDELDTEHPWMLRLERD